MSSTGPRARQAYLRLGYGAPSAERWEALPALGVARLRVARIQAHPGGDDRQIRSFLLLPRGSDSLDNRSGSALDELELLASPTPRRLLRRALRKPHTVASQVRNAQGAVWSSW
jgi:hypothetical protein